MRSVHETPCRLDRMGEDLAERSVADDCDMSGSTEPLEPVQCAADNPDTESWAPHCNALVVEDSDGYAAVAEGVCAFRALCYSGVYRGDATEAPAWFSPEVPLQDAG